MWVKKFDLTNEYNIKTWIYLFKRIASDVISKLFFGCYGDIFKTWRSRSKQFLEVYAEVHYIGLAEQIKRILI